MKKINSTAAAILALTCALAFPVETFGAASDYKNIAAEIVKYAKVNGVNKMAVLGFRTKSGTKKNEAEYVSEKISTYLAGNKKPALIERALIGKVLNEAKLSSAANDPLDKAKMLQDIFSIDAIVTGTIFASGKKLKIIARLIDIKTGRVLFATEAETWRIWPDFPEPLFSSMEPPAILGFDISSGWVTASLPSLPPDFKTPVMMPGFPEHAVSPRPIDFRDSISDSDDNSCAGKRRLLTKLNSELVDAKARYWAAAMKKPDFKASSLRKNPGSEIGDPGLKAKFYKLLSGYYKTDNAAPPEPAKLSRVIKLMGMEMLVSDECGLY